MEKNYGDTDGLATLIYVKEKGKWLMTAGENVDIVAGAQPFDLVNQMPKKRLVRKLRLYEPLTVHCQSAS